MIARNVFVLSNTHYIALYCSGVSLAWIGLTTPYFIMISQLADVKWMNSITHKLTCASMHWHCTLLTVNVCSQALNIVLLHCLAQGISSTILLDEHHIKRAPPESVWNVYGQTPHHHQQWQPKPYWCQLCIIVPRKFKSKQHAADGGRSTYCHCFSCVFEPIAAVQNSIPYKC